MPYQNINVSPAAFGAGEGAALQRTGGQLQQAGSELSSAAIQRQMIVNQTNADDVTNQIEHAAQTAQYGDPNDPSNPGFYALEGSNAMNAYKPTLDRLEQQRTDALNTLTNPRARHMAEQASRRIVDYARGLMGRHYDQAVKTYGIAAQTAAINLGMQGIGAAWNNDDIFNNHLADMQNSQARRDELAGASPEVAQWNQAQLLSKALTARVEGAIPYDTGAASKLLEQAQGKIPAAEYARLYSTIQTKSNTLAATHGANNFITNLDATYGGTPQNEAPVQGGAPQTAPHPNNIGNVKASENTFQAPATPTDGVTLAANTLRKGYQGMTLQQIGQKWVGRNQPQQEIDNWVSNVSRVSGVPAGATPDLDNPVQMAALVKGIGVAEKSPADQQKFTDQIISNGVHAALGGAAPAQAPQQPTYQTRADYYEEHAAEINDHLQAYAQQQAPDNPLVQDKIIRDVQEHMRTTIQAQNQQIAHDGNTVERWANGDFSNGQKPTAMEQMPQQVRDAYQRWEQRKPVEARSLDNVLKANAKTDIGYGAGFWPLLKQAYTHQITDPTKLYAYTNDPTGITGTGLGALSKEMQGAASPQGAAEAAAKLNFFEQARKLITGTNEEAHVIDPKGDKEFDKFLAQALPAYDAMRKGTDKSPGLPPSEILNPKSTQHYLGNLIPQFARDPSKDIAEIYNATPEYRDSFVDTTSAEAMGADLQKRIAAKQITWAQAAAMFQEQFPDAAKEPPQVPIAGER